MKASKGAKGLVHHERMAGSTASTRAMAARFFHAAGELPGIALFKALQAHAFIRARAVSCRWDLGTPRSSIARATLSSTVRQGSRVSAWEIYPTDGRMP